MVWLPVLSPVFVQGEFTTIIYKCCVGKKRTMGTWCLAPTMGGYTIRSTLTCINGRNSLICLQF